MYIIVANMTMRFPVAIVFNFIITYLVLPDNVYKKKNPNDRSLILDIITITEQVESFIRKS